MSEADITRLKDKNSEPQPEVVERLEVALEKARSGELRDVCIVGSLIGGYVHTSYDTSDIIDLVGKLEHLKHRLLMGLVEDGPS